MFKRTFWFTVGTATGLGSSYYLQRRVKQAAQRFTPEGLSREVSGAAKNVRTSVKAAVAEGREAAREREIELTDQLNGPVESSRLPAGQGTPRR